MTLTDLVLYLSTFATYKTNHIIMEIETARPYEPDDATASLILQLQNEDIDRMLNTEKGKGREGEFSDAHLALTAYQQELQTMNVILTDRCMSRSLTRAVISDAALLNESLTEENTAVSDRALAHSLAETNTLSAAPEQTASPKELDEDFATRPAMPYFSGGNSGNGSLDDTIHSDGPASRPNTPTTPSRHCIACDLTKPLSDICQTPCGHFYCQECIQSLFELSTADETLYPPRCCRQVIPLSSVKIYFSSATVQNFEKKSIEFETSDRTYCSRQTCSNFIPPVHIAGERATCEDCGTQTCTVCKSNAHDGDCP